ncbi:peptidylprolyl isomerase [Aetokthonos hydrillicola Thurmond2011]|jgi:parvulin-like peptidyl-prolyl isomerase|uniref:peptidylprolyl isomerase n=1 Tax=Aetokthonos hydrillicola Thurmond2011 TaxID=2712845 RepID=A0AAP5M8K6_9CYAN|nr:peptidylprolyl isomerase [Aetokthonos hydrillicola]MBO3463802.1 peptidylprolyl isomerase [Aetokthonos hydrillicola CCALA 1050]MBW4590257.1 peptidylprolyl isomerase [Aetokthonos hydrillicola CCALA 1050]MDR9894827.1 peptidylprolyl isomerase [Aetokthonos hydrillicola Thurmond2011]
MKPLAFLTVDDQTISIEQAVKYLQASGKLRHFIGDILRHYVIEQELLTREDIVINSAVTEQTIIDFRLKNKLTDPENFQEWLKNNGTDYTSFHSSIAFNFKLEKLKTVLTETKIQEYFIERKIFLDRVVLSRIIVDNKELAEELQAQIEEGASFEQLAREYSLAEDKIVNGMMGPVSRGTMPDILRAAIDMATPGKLVGPIELEERYGLFRVEQFLSASLEDTQLKQALQNELFEKWLAEKIQKLTVKLQVN